MTEVRLTDPQYEFVTADDQAPALVAGYGSGKTYAAVARSLRLKLENPAQMQAYYLPTYDLVSKIAVPRFQEMAAHMGVPCLLRKNDGMLDIGSDASYGSVLFRTLDSPERIIGYEVADSVADELDTLPMDKAADTWVKMLGRNRQKKANGKPNTIAVATTPEGYRFVYDRWVRNPLPGYRLIRASTYSNSANLPADYIDNLKKSYPPNLLAAYLEGEFVNLTSSSCYPDYDRVLNGTTAEIVDNEPLHVSIDFNVGVMATNVWVMRHRDQPHAVDELHGCRDTPELIDRLKARYPGHAMLVYPDASGKARKSVNASQSDISLLRAAGFMVCVNNANPAVRDRLLAMNRMISTRKLRVNDARCPMLAESLERQSYDKWGEPSKEGGYDHHPDGAGYFITYRYPIVARTIRFAPLLGV